LQEALLDMASHWFH